MNNTALSSGLTYSKRNILRNRKVVVIALLTVMFLCELCAWITPHSNMLQTSKNQASIGAAWSTLPCGGCKTVQACSHVTESDAPLCTKDITPPDTSRDCSQLEPVLQNPQLPNGCELASLTALLRYEGFQVSFEDLDLPKQDFTYSHNGTIRYGPDPEEYYVGEPSSATDGWYCFEGPLVQTANLYLKEQGNPLCARILSGTPLSQLETWLANGIPVTIWFTTNYALPQYSTTFSWVLPNGDTYVPYVNLHCVVLIEADEDTCTLADPLRGITQIKRSLFETIYSATGMRAIALSQSTAVNLSAVRQSDEKQTEKL